MTTPSQVASPNGKYLRVNDLTMYYETYGSGRPLILLHGALYCTGAVWAPHIPIFAKHFLVIVPDARGHGRTNNPRGEISIPLLAEDEMAFQRALGLEKPFVCGLSLGGMTAIEVGMRYPDSIGALVPVAALAHRRLPPEAMEEWDAIAIKGPGIVDTERFERNDPARAQRLRGLHLLGEDHWKTLVRQIAVMNRNPTVHDVADYRKITAPTLVVMGDRDEFFPVEDATEMYRMIPGAELAVMPQGGHGLFAPRGKFLDEMVLDFFARRG